MSHVPVCMVLITGAHAARRIEFYLHDRERRRGGKGKGLSRTPTSQEAGDPVPTLWESLTRGKRASEVHEPCSQIAKALTATKFVGQQAARSECQCVRGTAHRRSPAGGEWWHLRAPRPSPWAVLCPRHPRSASQPPQGMATMSPT